MPSHKRAPLSAGPASDGAAVVWFRDDLRVADNRALAAAAGTGWPILAVYVLDEESPGIRALGSASRWWLHHSLESLAADLRKLGSELHIHRGAAGALIPKLAYAAKASCVFWSRRTGAPERDVDTAVKSALREAGIEAQSCNDHLLTDPWQVKSKAGEPFRVFTPYWRASQACGDPPAPQPAPKRLVAAEPPSTPKPVTLDDLALLPTKPDWAAGLRETWTPGEHGARARLADFLAHGLAGYAANRDRPDRDATSRLSPHLRFGEIGPRQVWHAVTRAAEDGKASHADAEKFLSELGWREFSHHLLFYSPELAAKNFDARFDDFPWRSDAKALKAWHQGRTGVPLVDAGMRQLWHTGTMHNRVRMIAASFLIKHLLIDWREGESWFWDTLVDADPANNPASWQWVAGSGADAAPYFRIFNPVLQATKFDPEGHYVRRWVPELSALPPRHIHAPWLAPEDALAQAGVMLGRTYPRPIVDLGEGRARALAAFQKLKG
jgi:deoxyribodipyrimidine photo-lyase